MDRKAGHQENNPEQKSAYYLKKSLYTNPSSQKEKPPKQAALSYFTRRRMPFHAKYSISVIVGEITPNVVPAVTRISFAG